MEYRKKLQKRFYYAVAYLLLGVALNLTAYLTKSENYFLSGFGSCLIVMGIVRMIRHKRLVSSDQAVKKQEIAETDERNIMLAEKARSWAFAAYIILAGTAVIILSLASLHDIAQPLSYSICLLVALYWIFFYILRKKY